MILLVLVLTSTEKSGEILYELYQAGITGTTVIESNGMGETTLENMPLFGGIRALFYRQLSPNQVIFSVIESEETTQKAIGVIESIIGDLELGKKGILFTLKLEQVKGFTSHA